MKIAFIDESYNTTEAGGAEIWTHLLKTALTNKGNDCSIFSYGNGINTKIPNRIKSFPYLREGFVYPYVGLNLVPKIENNFDVLFYSSITTPALCKTDTRSIIYANCLFSRQTKYFQSRLPLRYKPFFNTSTYTYFKLLEKKSLQNVNCIAVPKNDVKRFMVEHLKISPDKIKVVCVGIDTKLFQPPQNFDSREKIALFVGRGTIAKGFDTVLAAASKINGKVIAVAQRVANHYKNIADNISNLELIPRLNHTELLKLYQRASVFMLPSLSEGVPVTTLEAMACGLPVVCSIEGGGEKIEDGINGYITPFRDPHSLAKKVNYLFDHSYIANKFGDVNYNLIKNQYTIEHSTAKMLEIFEDCN